MTLGLGIASIYARDAAAAHAGARTLADLSGRSVRHGPRRLAPLSVSARGTTPRRSAAMTAYLDAYASAAWRGPAVDDPPLVLAALGPRMLALAGTRAAGAFPYLVTARDGRRGAAQPRRGGGRRHGRPDRPVLDRVAAIHPGRRPEVDARAARGTVGAPPRPAELPRQPAPRRVHDRPDQAGRRSLAAEGSWRPATRPNYVARIQAMLGAGADHVAVIPRSPRVAARPTARVWPAPSPATAS